MYIPINERAHKFAEIKRIFSQYTVFYSKY